VSDELERIWKQEALAYSKTTFQHLCGTSKDATGNPIQDSRFPDLVAYSHKAELLIAYLDRHRRASARSREELA
jgi:hypothetical protein